MKKDVATIKFHDENKEIWDYRNLSLIKRIKIGLSLILTGIVEIQWKKMNEQTINTWEKK